jgi:metal-responsive CopG/Arc/MetJ family transcriptional regulator
MASAKVAITLDFQLLRTLDRWVKQCRYPNRSQAIQAALREKLERWKRIRLVEEVSKLNPREEKFLADEKISEEIWPE